jgi:hypothetical protein
MFAKSAKSKIISARQAASSVALAHSNANTVIARAGRLSRTRPNLVCRWRPKIGGGFECHWDIKPADEVATEGPDPTLHICPRASFPYPVSYRTQGRERTCHRRAAQRVGRWMNSET